MEELLFLLMNFVFVLLMFQICFFEINFNRVKKSDNLAWFLSLDKSFNYTRTGYMAFVCFICYIFSSSDPFLSINWILYFVLFLALGIVADAIVQFLTLKYGQIRCKKQIEYAKSLKQEVLNLKTYNDVNDEYHVSMKEYEETNILRDYVTPHDHLAFLSIDQGEFAKNYAPLPNVVYDVEPYGDIEQIKENLFETPIKPTTLTQAQQMPFKDNKIDVIMNQFCNYEKNELKRVLKPNGYVILNQYGTGNYQELVDMYMPFKMKGEWNVQSCSESLESIGFKIVQRLEDFGYIQFRSIEGMYSYFKRVSPDLSDVEKYVNFYMTALKRIKEGSTFKLSTYKFLVVARNEM